MTKRSRKSHIPTCEFVCEESSSDCGVDLYVVLNGERFARRGYPGTPQAKQWISLVLGIEVKDTQDGNGLVIEHHDVVAGHG